MATTCLRVALFLALPAVLAADTAFAVAQGWWPHGPLLRPVAAGAWLPLGLVLLVLPFGRGRAWLARWSGRLAAASLAFAASLAGLELYARGLDPDFHTRQPNQIVECETEPGVLPGIEGRTRVTLNSRGMRGPEIEGAGDAYRVLCLGGSTTECFYLDDSQTWPQLVMDAFGGVAGGMWVGSSGIAGFDTTHHLRFVRSNEIVGRIDCMVLLVGINDLQLSLVPWRLRTPRWARSRAFALVAKLIRAAADRDMAFENQDGTAYVRRREARRRAPKLDTPPDLAPGLDGFADRVREIVAELRRRNVRPVFMTQPVLWSDDLSPESEALLWMARLHDGTSLSTRAARAAMDRFNERLLRTCRELEVECVDLAELSGRPELFFDDCHFTPAGARAVAARLIAFLDGSAAQPLEATAPRGSAAAPPAAAAR